MEIKETWFLLFAGESEDGLGSGKYVGRTTDAKVAEAHFRKIQDNPYSTGRVNIVTEDDYSIAGWWTDWSSY